MMSKTHAEIGVAATLGASLLIPAMQTHSVGTFTAGLFAAVVGSTIPDIDSSFVSKPKKALMTALGAAILAVISLLRIGVSAEAFFEGFSVKRLIGAVLIATYLILGLISSHRTFTHQLIGLLMASLGVFFLLGRTFALWVGIGMLSHQLADMANCRKIEWLYPLHIDFTRHLFKSDSFRANLTGYIALIAAAFFLYLYMDRFLPPMI